MRNQDRHRNLYEDPVATLVPHYDITFLVMHCISVSCVIWLRKRIGYRLLQPWLGCLMFLGFFCVGYLLAHSPEGNAVSYRDGSVFMILAFGLTSFFFMHRHRAWQTAVSGDNPPHSMSRGDSILAPIFRLLFIPQWFVQRWVEPILLFAIGFELLQHQESPALGWWLMVSAACVAGAESEALHRQKNALLDLRDARIEGQILMKLDKAAGKQQAHTKQRAAQQGRIAALSPELEQLRPGDYRVTRQRNR